MRTAIRTTDKYVFFWNGIYSQWHPSPVKIDGKKFNCMEQWMMYNKAILFKDNEMAELIMSTDNPRLQKEYGRTVKNFDAKKWDDVAFDIVKRGNYEKFTQNKDLQKQLLDTGDRILVEASPVDRIWGIGMAQYDVGVENEKNWRGRNLLGKAITEVKNIIKNEQLS